MLASSFAFFEDNLSLFWIEITGDGATLTRKRYSHIMTQLLCMQLTYSVNLLATAMYFIGCIQLIRRGDKVLTQTQDKQFTNLDVLSLLQTVHRSSPCSLAVAHGIVTANQPSIDNDHLYSSATPNRLSLHVNTV